MEKSYVNNYFDHVYVLNLRKRSDRKLAMLQKLSRLGIQAEFVEAVDGYSEKSQLDYNKYLDAPLGKHPLELSQNRKMVTSSGAWGYLKTFSGILKDAKRRNFSRILCFDDDAIFHSDFEKEFVRNSKIIPNDWKLLYLGASQHVFKIPGGFSYPDVNKKELDPSEPYYYPKTTDGSFAVGIDCSVYDLLLLEVLQMNCAFDSGPLRKVITTFPDKCIVLNPNIVIADVSESDIQGGRSQAEIAIKFNWDMVKYDYPFKKDLVSVIMPVYNCESTIKKAIQSMLLQTYENIEVIVVDDDSLDKTKEVVSDIMKFDSRIRLISLQKNGGAYIARNEGIKESKGDMIAFQDGDDISLKSRIEKQLIPLYEKDVLFSIARIYRSRCDLDELDIENQEDLMRKVESKREMDEKGRFTYEDRPILGLATCIFRRRVFEQYGLFSELRVAGDLEYVERILFHQTKSLFDNNFNGHTYIDKCFPINSTFVRIDEVLLVCGKMNENNITNDFKNKKEELIRIKKRFREKIKLGNLKMYEFLYKRMGLGLEFPALKYNTLFINDETQVKESLQIKTLKSRTLENSNSLNGDNELQDIYNSISWRITSPIRWFGRVVMRKK